MKNAFIIGFLFQDLCSFKKSSYIKTTQQTHAASHAGGAPLHDKRWEERVLIYFFATFSHSSLFSF